MPDYIPRSDAGILLWYTNFAQKFAQFSTQLGFTAADVTGVNNELVTVQFAIGLVETFKAEARERVAYRNTLFNGTVGSVTPPVPTTTTVTTPANLTQTGVLARTRALVARIKSHPNYTETMGRDLQILSSGVTPPSGTPKPVLTLSQQPGTRFVQIKFVKNGFSGVRIESKRPSEADWTSLGNAIVSPFVDMRPFPAGVTSDVRMYRAVFVRGNTPVGDWSDAPAIAVA